MKTIAVKRRMFLKACRMCFDKRLFTLYSSFTGGNGAIAGMLGELLVNEYIKGRLTSTKHYDIIQNKKKIEVKTKRTSVEPLPYYTCGTYNIDQECDYYFFTRVFYSYKKAYILGWLSRADFIKKAKHYKKGQVIDEGFKANADCWLVHVKDLKQKWKS